MCDLFHYQYIKKYCLKHVDAQIENINWFEKYVCDCSSDFYGLVCSKSFGFYDQNVRFVEILKINDERNRII